MWWRANILIDDSGSAVGPDGTSGSLTLGRDRALLREIRQEANVVVTGGESVRREGWFFPPNGSLLVLTQSKLLPVETCPHPERLIICSDIAAAKDAIQSMRASRVLCEGGPRLVRLLVSHNLLDEVFVSVVTVSAENHENHAASIARSVFDLAVADFDLDDVVNDDGISFTRFRRRRVTDLT